jgi:thiamine transport system permease protein
MFTFVFKVLPVGSSLKAPSFPNLRSPLQKPIIGLALLLILLPILAILVPSLMALPQTLSNPLVGHAFLKSLSLSLFLGPLSVLLTVLLVIPKNIFVKPVASLYLLVPPAFLGALLFYLSLEMPDLSSEVFLMIVQLFIILPFSFRLLKGPYDVVQTTYGDTARGLGLTGFQKWRLIDWPLLKKPLATTLGVGCALSLGDFQSLAFFASPESPGLSSLLYQQMARHFDESMGTALVLLLVCYFLYQLPHWMLKYDRSYA